MTDDLRAAMRHPAVVVFLLTALGAIIGWGVRQEIINQRQQHQIDILVPPVEIQRRLGRLEDHVDALEKAAARK